MTGKSYERVHSLHSWKEDLLQFQPFVTREGYEKSINGEPGFCLKSSNDERLHGVFTLKTSTFS